MSGQPLQGKTALVTGAAKRLGRATALALGAEGVNVVVHYGESAQEGADTCAQLRGLGVKAWAVQADLARPKAPETLIARVLKEAGSLDILVNSASIFPPSALAEMTFEQVVETLRVNAWAPFALGRDFARRVGRGKIVNLLDARIVGYDWAHAAYYLSKQMLAVLTRMMALEFAPHVTVNAVAPGLILPPPGEDESYLDRLSDTVPLKRHGEAEDVTEAIVYLLKSDFVTGQVLFVDGGRHLRGLGHGSNPD